MNLASCNICGIVLDKDRIYFPDPYNTTEEGTELNEHAHWDGDEYVSGIPCPVCKTPILENQ